MGLVLVSRHRVRSRVTPQTHSSHPAIVGVGDVPRNPGVRVGDGCGTVSRRVVYGSGTRPRLNLDISFLETVFGTGPPRLPDHLHTPSTVSSHQLSHEDLGQPRGRSTPSVPSERPVRRLSYKIHLPSRSRLRDLSPVAHKVSNNSLSFYPSSRPGLDIPV